MKIKTLAIAATLALTQFNAIASARWFDIEVIAFERPTSAKVTEDFKLEQAPIDISKSYDIISEYLISECKRLEQEALAEQASSDELTEIPQNNAITENQAEITTENIEPIALVEEEIDQKPACEDIAARSEIPFELNAPEQTHQDFRYLLAQSELQLTDAVQKLRRQGLKPIVHLAWRQEETSKRNAITQRLFGGKNFADRFLVTGEPVPTPEFINNTSENPVFGETAVNEANEEAIATSVESYNEFVETVLESDNLAEVLAEENNKTATEAIWQLDGLFTVYIRNNYLNIETQLNLRSEDLENNVLDTIYFDQFKRVISGEIHYFDHPKMGLIVQIRRYAH